MARIYIQSTAEVFDSTASMAGAGSTSGSIPCAGYSRIVGMLITSSSLAAGSGLRIYQSMDGGTNWDVWENNTVSTCSGSIFTASLGGNAVKVTAKVGATDASIFRARFYLLPI